jgi:hypothetical protein
LWEEDKVGNDDKLLLATGVELELLEELLGLVELLEKYKVGIGGLRSGNSGENCDGLPLELL